MLASIKLYLGDGVFADFDGHDVILTVEDGVETTNTVYLEPEVLANFQAFIARLDSARTAAEDAAANPDNSE